MGETGGQFIYSEQLKTLPYALSQIVAGGIARAGVAAAVGVIMMILQLQYSLLTKVKSSKQWVLPVSSNRW